MAEDPFEMIKIVMIMSTHDADASTCRNSAVKHQFDREQGYPHGRKGYIVDHVCAIGCTGKDITANMQYQTIEASRKKDRWETTPVGCKLTCNPQNSTKTRQVFNCK